jgi:hypothetical protein
VCDRALEMMEGVGFGSGAASAASHWFILTGLGLGLSLHQQLLRKQTNQPMVGLHLDLYTTAYKDSDQAFYLCEIASAY